jgi:hypothetical protein
MTIQANIRELSIEEGFMIGGGDYVETTLGLVYGLSFGAGVLVGTPVSAPVLGAALAIGAGLLLFEML